jgi:hypothetical protein
VGRELFADARRESGRRWDGRLMRAPLTLLPTRRSAGSREERVPGVVPDSAAAAAKPGKPAGTYGVKA